MEKLDCPGFQSAGIASGLKKTGKKDLGLIYSKTPLTVAAMFTRNLVKAAALLIALILQFRIARSITQPLTSFGARLAELATAGGDAVARV